ncbi:hypothetical protein DNTS_033011, partial [Danionella cerebrum]
ARHLAAGPLAAVLALLLLEKVLHQTLEPADHRTDINLRLELKDPEETIPGLVLQITIFLSDSFTPARHESVAGLSAGVTENRGGSCCHSCSQGLELFAALWATSALMSAEEECRLTGSFQLQLKRLKQYRSNLICDNGMHVPESNDPIILSSSTSEDDCGGWLSDGLCAFEGGIPWEQNSSPAVITIGSRRNTTSRIHPYESFTCTRQTNAHSYCTQTLEMELSNEAGVNQVPNNGRITPHFVHSGEKFLHGFLLSCTEGGQALFAVPKLFLFRDSASDRLLVCFFQAIGQLFLLSQDFSHGLRLRTELCSLRRAKLSRGGQGSEAEGCRRGGGTGVGGGMSTEGALTLCPGSPIVSAGGCMIYTDAHKHEDTHARHCRICETDMAGTQGKHLMSCDGRLTIGFGTGRDWEDLTRSAQLGPQSLTTLRSAPPRRLRRGPTENPAKIALNKTLRPLRIDPPPLQPDGNGLAYPKLRARRTPGDGTIRSEDGLDITCRPGDILRTSQAKELIEESGAVKDVSGCRPVDQGYCGSQHKGMVEKILPCGSKNQHLSYRSASNANGCCGRGNSNKTSVNKPATNRAAVLSTASPNLAQHHRRLNTNQLMRGGSVNHDHNLATYLSGVKLKKRFGTAPRPRTQTHALTGKVVGWWRAPCLHMSSISTPSRKTLERHSDNSLTKPSLTQTRKQKECEEEEEEEEEEGKVQKCRLTSQIFWNKKKNLTILLFALYWDAPCDEVSSSSSFFCHYLPHLIMTVGTLERCLRRQRECLNSSHVQMAGRPLVQHVPEAATCECVCASTLDMLQILRPIGARWCETNTQRHADVNRCRSKIWNSRNRKDDIVKNKEDLKRSFPAGAGIRSAGQVSSGGSGCDQITVSITVDTAPLSRSALVHLTSQESWYHTDLVL